MSTPTEVVPDADAAHRGREHSFTIIVNGRKKVVTDETLTFEQILDLAYDGHPNPGPNIVFTVTFRNAASRPHEGTMVAGNTVTVKNETIFNVTRTDKS